MTTALLELAQLFFVCFLEPKFYLGVTVLVYWVVVHMLAEVLVLSHVIDKIIIMWCLVIAGSQTREILQAIVNNKHLHHGLTKLDWK